MDKKKPKQPRIGGPSRLSCNEKRSRKQSLSMSAGIGRLELRRLRVGDARCDLLFERSDDGNLRVALLRMEGDLDVIVDDVIVDTEGAFDFARQERAA